MGWGWCAHHSGIDSLQALGSIRCNVQVNNLSLDAELNNIYYRLASGMPTPFPTSLEDGSCFKLAEKEVRLDFPITHQSFLSGRHCSPIHTGDVDTTAVRTSASSIKQFVPPTQFRPPIGSSSAPRKSIFLHPVNLIKAPETPVDTSHLSKSSPDSYWSAQWFVQLPLFTLPRP